MAFASLLNIAKQIEDPLPHKQYITRTHTSYVAVHECKQALTLESFNFLVVLE